MDLVHCWKRREFDQRRLIAADLIGTAKRRCRLDDFGAGEFLEALSRLLDSCQEEARLNLIGKIALKVDVLEALCARLKMERDRQLYPNISRQEIRQAAVYCRVASQRHQCAAQTPRRGPGTSSSSDVGSKVAIATYSRA